MSRWLILLPLLLASSTLATDLPTPSCQVGAVSSFGSANFDQRSSLLHIFPSMRPSCEGLVRAVTFYNPTSNPQKLFYFALFNAIDGHPGAFRLINYVKVVLTSPMATGWQTVQLASNAGWKPPLLATKDTIFGYFYETWSQAEPNTVIPFANKMANRTLYPAYVGLLGLREVTQIQELQRAIVLDVVVQHRLPALYAAVISPLTDELKPCGSPPLVQHAHVETKTSIETSRPGDAVTFGCDDGYALLQNKFVVCQPDGIWSALPYCTLLPKIPYCPQPDDLDNGTISFRSWSRGDWPQTGAVVRYRCDLGFTLIGSSELRCTPPIWNQLVPSCQESDNCGPLPDQPANTHIIDDSISGEDTGLPGDYIHYACHDGFTFDGMTAVSMCDNATRSWTPISPCIPVPVTLSCGPEPDAPPHATSHDKQLSGDLDTGLPDDFIHYTCERGFAFDGPDDISYCDNATLRWTPISACIRIIRTEAIAVSTCGEPPAIPDNAVVLDKQLSQAGNSQGGQGDYIHYGCQLGYIFDGLNDISNCNAPSYSWTDVSPCVATCGAPPNVPHGSVVNQDFDGDVSKVGSIVEYTCEPGFDIVFTGDAPMSTCTDDGHWDQLVQCSPHPSTQPQVVTCGDPPKVANAAVDQYGDDGIQVEATPGTQVIYVCESGYSLVGSSKLTCGKDGKWPTTNLPKCKKLTKCGPAPPIANGVIEWQNFSGNDSIPGSIARYHCLRGYNNLPYPPMEVRCQRTGKWPTVLPRCQLKTSKN